MKNEDKLDMSKIDDKVNISSESNEVPIKKVLLATGITFGSVGTVIAGYSMLNKEASSSDELQSNNIHEDGNLPDTMEVKVDSDVLESNEIGSELNDFGSNTVLQQTSPDKVSEHEKMMENVEPTEDNSNIEIDSDESYIGIDALSFSKAFWQSRGEGKDIFNWRGNLYTTETKEEYNERNTLITPESDFSTLQQALPVIEKSKSIDPIPLADSKAGAEEVPELFDQRNNDNSRVPDLFDMTSVVKIKGRDEDSDGKIDTIAIDENNDGIIDKICIDDNKDNKINILMYDTNSDGVMDIMIQDSNGNGLDIDDQKENIEIEMDTKTFEDVDQNPFTEDINLFDNIL